MRVTILGCGTSTGVPMVACDCPVCSSDEPKNRRMRPSVQLQHEGQVVLIDTSTDLRQQCLEFGIRRVDAVLYTHAHADHIFGLDDLRPFNFRQGTDIPCYGSRRTLGRIRQCFDYVFEEGPQEGGGRPRLRLVEVAGTFTVCGLEVQAIPVWHGSMEVYAYRIGNFAYVTDCNRIDEASLEQLRGVEVLILDALGYKPHSTHYSVPEAIDVAAEIGARQTYFTHMNHQIDYNAPQVTLPAAMEFAYDGLTLDV